MQALISLSTCWLSQRHDDGYAMLREIADLGFEYVELSHGIRLALVPGIIKAVEEGWIKVSSLHNFCPLPAGITGASPNLFQPSAKAVIERNLWVKNTLRTMDFALSLGAKVMVAHMGSVRFFWSDPLKKTYPVIKEKGLVEAVKDPQFLAQIQKIVKKAQKKETDFLKRVKDCVDYILPFAKDMGVRLAIENRDGILEIPLSNQHAAFLDLYKEEPLVGSWYDTGHGYIRETLGIQNSETLLKNIAPRLIGFHLKDVSPAGKDDQPIAAGILDFKKILEHAKAEHLFVLEIGHKAEPGQIIESKKNIEQILKELDIFKPTRAATTCDVAPRG